MPVKKKSSHKGHKLPKNVKINSKRRTQKKRGRKASKSQRGGKCEDSWVPNPDRILQDEIKVNALKYRDNKDNKEARDAAINAIVNALDELAKQYQKHRDCSTAKLNETTKEYGAGCYLREDDPKIKYGDVYENSSREEALHRAFEGNYCSMCLMLSGLMFRLCLTNQNDKLI